MIIKTIFNMFQKLKDINAIKTRVKECIHAFKRRLQRTAHTFLPNSLTVTPKYVEAVAEKH